MNTQLIQSNINQLPISEQVLLLENTLQTLKEKVFAEIESTDTYRMRMIFKILQLNSEASVLQLVAEQLQTDKHLETSESFENYRTVQKAKYKHLPIIWGEGKPDINDFAGIWKDKDITLETLREKAWKRNL
jgi:hypothetical protein